MEFLEELNCKDRPQASRVLAHSDEYITARGEVKLTRRNLLTGEIIGQPYEDHNLIVIIGREAVLHILGGDRTNSAITKIALGTGGAPVDNPFSPVPPVDGDVALVTEVFRDNLDSHSYPTRTSLRFVKLVTSDQINAIVNEALLLFNDNITALARFTYPSQYLRNDFGSSLEIDWTIQL